MTKKLYVTDVPHMIKMWDYDKNTDDPSKVSVGSNNSYVWTCNKCGYFRSRPVKKIYKGSGKCPCCETNKVICTGINDVLTKVKDFDKFYDFDNNNGFDITSVGVDCGKKVNYKCPECRRSWSATVKAQIRKLPDGTYEAVGCPHYNTVKRKKEDVPYLINDDRIMRFFDHDNNDIDPTTTKINSTEHINLKCKNCGYAWNPEIRTFFKGKMLCKCCELNMVVKSGINDLLTLIPDAGLDLLEEDNPNIDIHSLAIRDKTEVVWRCHVCGKTWPSPVASRVEGKKGSYSLRKCQDCYLSGTERITPISDVPRVLKYYDTERNEKDPSEVSVHSTEPVFLKCPDCGFSWKASPKSRYAIKNDACPCCDSGKYIQTGKTDVLTLCPDIAAILDKEKNPGLDLSKEAINSGKEFIFSCKKCGYEWPDTIRNRTKKKSDGSYQFHDCPKCSNKARRSVTYDIQYPDLAEMYDNTANQRPLSSITSYESNSLLLKWICPTCHEQFESRLQSMITARNTSTKGCPYCSHTKLRPGESFGDLHPELLDEYAESNDIDPFTVFPGCKDIVKWVCRNDSSHRWEASFALRHSGAGKCAICYRTGRDLTKESFAAVYPAYLDMYSENNDRKPSDIFYTAPNWLKWVCRKCGHEFGGEIDTIVNDTENACPYCNSRIIQPEVNSLKALRPDIAKYWLDTNVLKVDEVFVTAGYRAWFSCPDCGNPINEIISDFVNGKYDCPYCNGRQAMPGKTSLAALYPDIAKLYSSKNPMDADHVFPNVSTNVAWECDVCGQEFHSTIKDMVDGAYNCPYCNNRLPLPGVNTFKANHLDLMDEWDTLSNYCLGVDPDTILDNYGSKVWWICPNDNTHRYEMSVSERLFYQKRHREPCCYCKGRRRKKIFNNV